MKGQHTLTFLPDHPAVGGDSQQAAPTLRAPQKHDAAAIHGLVSQCEPLDLNSLYTYLLLSEHFHGTCVIAQGIGGAEGFVSAYIPPGRPDVLFVWQVAVHKSARGKGLARTMLDEILRRPGMSAIQYIETTVGPDNHASRNLFASMARSLGADLCETPLFGGDLFGMHVHDDEPLIRIGPFRVA